MTMNRLRLLAFSVACGALLLAACRDAAPPQPVTNQAANGNANAGTTARPPNNAPLNAVTDHGPSSAGDPIDTSRYDAQIEQATRQAERNPADATTRNAVAQAYVQRGNALTQARQYRAALGDYRRALRYDPDNEDAQRGASLISGIMQSMGRQVPDEGDEPPPLPITPDAIAGDEGDTGAGTTNRAPARGNTNRP